MNIRLCYAVLQSMKGTIFSYIASKLIEKQRAIGLHHKRESALSKQRKRTMEHKKNDGNTMQPDKYTHNKYVEKESQQINNKSKHGSTC